MSNFDNLPPEMQQRIQNMIASANPNGAPQQQAPAQQQAPQERPVVPNTKPPSLMDHTIALRHELVAARQEIAALQGQVQAMAQVTDAVGNAVGQLYAMFHEQSTPSTYSEEFQVQAPSHVDDNDF